MDQQPSFQKEPKPTMYLTRSRVRYMVGLDLLACLLDYFLSVRILEKNSSIGTAAELQVGRPYLTLQVAVGLSPVPLHHLLPVAPDVGQDLIQTGFYGGVGFVHLTSGHLTVEDSNILQRHEIIKRDISLSQCKINI